MKTALVTGASRGIGEKIAERFAQEGYAVAINYNKSKNQAETLRDKIRAQGGTAEVFCADVSDDKKVHSMVDEIVRKFGTIDVLINNAGIALKQGLFTDFSGGLSMLCGYKISSSVFSIISKDLSAISNSTFGCGRRPNIPAITEYGAGTLFDPERI